MEGNYRNTEKRGELMIPAPVVPQSFSQLGLIIPDGSGSMEGPTLNGMSKAEAVGATIHGVLARFKVSSQRKNFRFGIVSFASEGRVMMEPTAAADIDDDASYDPRHSDGTDTFIGSGLLVARCLAEEFLTGANREMPTTVVMLVLSDGRDREASGAGPDETLQIAEEIKRNPAITICTAYFAQKGLFDPEAEDVLRRIASKPATGYKSVYDAETLRSFFLSSLSAERRI